MFFTVPTLTLLPSVTNVSSSLCLPVNAVILVLLAVAFLIIVQRNLLNLSDFLHKEHPSMFIFCVSAALYSVHCCCDHLIRQSLKHQQLIKHQMCLYPDAGMILPFESELSPDLRLEVSRKGKGEEIPVLITAAEDRLGAVVAAMNSVYQNSKANVAFTIVTMNDTVDHLK